MYFQVHQPFRLRRYSVFESHHHYFDDFHNAEICRKVAHKCYLPANELLLELIAVHDRRFRCAFSISGAALEQFEAWSPEVIDSFRRLNDTGAVEFLSETYHHSLSFLFSRGEFVEQVELHRQRMIDLFGQSPTVFRNTELIYSNDVAQLAAQLGFRGVLCEGADRLLGFRSPNFTYRPPACDGITLLLKNYRLSDDIAFRFCDRNWSEWPLTAEKFAHWVNQVNGNGFCVNLFMDYETLGEHQWAETGIFEFLRQMPGAVMEYRDNNFRKPQEVIDAFPPVGQYDAPHLISWADTERDLSAWLGNAMQHNALTELYQLEPRIKASGDAAVLADWRRMTTSDHAYYMCTKYFEDGDVHKYFSPYESPYDSYINFMNVLDNLSTRAHRPSK